MKREVASIILEAIENHTQGSISPVTGAQFKKLSKEYAAKKRKKTGSGSPDLHLNDKMIAAIKAHVSKGDGVEFAIKQKAQIGKAHNHNTRKTKKATSPKRQFMPNDEKGQQFNKRIRDSVKEYFSTLQEVEDGN